MVRGGVEAFGLQSLAEYLGWSFDLRFHVNSSADLSGLTQAQHDVLELVNGERSAIDIVRQSRLSAYHTANALYALDTSGVVEKQQLAPKASA